MNDSKPKDGQSMEAAVAKLSEEQQAKETYFIGWWAAQSFNAGTGALNDALREVAYKGFMAGWKCRTAEKVIGGNRFG